MGTITVVAGRFWVPLWDHRTQKEESLIKGVAPPPKVALAVWSWEGQRGMWASAGRWVIEWLSCLILPPLSLWAGQTYFVDDAGVYYLQCTDDSTSFCVVPNPQ